MGFFNKFLDSGSKTSGRGEYELVNRTLLAEDSNGVPPEASTTGASREGTWRQDEPTEHEKRNLRKVPDSLPWSAFLVAIVELCERFTYYGLSGPFQNYISNSYHDSNGLPGAIGLNQHGATALTNFFQFWCYITPVLGAIIADQFLGKYWTIFYFSICYMVGILILFVTSLPTSIENGLALPGLVAAMIVIGLGTGGIKSNVSPLIAEQYQHTKPYVKTRRNGERVLIDPAATIQRIYMIFYMCINVGSLSALVTTKMEAETGFWAAYLLCLVMFIIGFICLVAGKKKYVLHPPKGSVIPDAARICWIGMKKRSLDAAKPEHSMKPVSWDGLFVDEVRRALTACKVFLFFPIYWLVYGQMLNNFISQAGTMELHGIPNDSLQNINPITIIIFIPICDRILYPGLRKMGFDLKPITRMTIGFFLAATAMVYAAWVQSLIYNAGPCYDAPGACSAGLRTDGTHAPNKVHVAVQTPAYLLIGLSEIFASITGLEYAFNKAPPTMKSFTMSLFLLTNSSGAVFGALLSVWAVDPKLVWMYIGLATACFVTGCVFWILFRKLNYAENAMGNLGDDTIKPAIADEIATAAGRASIDDRL